MSEDKESKVVEITAASKRPDGGKVSRSHSGAKSGGGGTGNGTPERFGCYAVKNGCFVQLKPTTSKDGGFSEVEIVLTDFTCKILEEVSADDGINEANFLRIEGRRADGLALPAVDVPSKSFFSAQSNWIGEYWGTLAFLYPGPAKKDNLRAAVQLYSSLNGDPPRRRVYRYTGWKRIDDRWHYLTGSGAITAAGLADTVQVDLGAGHMSRYALPPPLAGAELKPAAEAALGLLAVTPARPHVGAALLAAVARAPLGECQPTDFALWLHGLTGSRKSAVAAIAQAFFGDFGSGRTFPANWADSANDAEMKGHQSKDAIFTIDDYKPSVSLAEAGKLHAMAERLIRGVGNQSGRGRRDANMSAKAAPHCRALMLITGEDLPKGQSLLGRLLVLELGRADVDNAVLSKLQEAARLSLFSGLMSAYVQWLASRMDEFKTAFPAAVQALRDGAIRDGFAASHPRAPEIYANLVAGFEMFLDFLEQAGAMSCEQGGSWLDQAETGLRAAFAEQGSYQQEQDECRRFFELLRAALASGNGHIANRINQGPPATKPYAYGWRDAGSDITGDRQYNPMGDCIGWHTDGTGHQPAEVWLQPDAAFKVAQDFARRQGDAFLLSAPSLWRRLCDRGLLLKTEPDGKTGKPRTAIKRVVNNAQSVRVLVVNAELLVESFTAEQSQSNAR
ncbi:cell wall-binding protein [Methylomonas rhizoryzae]|uniref:cell wall-binding protein n=1 Tax=Methylomonas rhizoryzae TaxID=2608981 RepID=UPI001232E64D|nr:cell wall-binding protein [Methylomonas rhizoryzae]